MIYYKGKKFSKTGKNKNNHLSTTIYQTLLSSLYIPIIKIFAFCFHHHLSAVFLCCFSFTFFGSHRLASFSKKIFTNFFSYFFSMIGKIFILSITLDPYTRTFFQSLSSSSLCYLFISSLAYILFFFLYCLHSAFIFSLASTASLAFLVVLSVHCTFTTSSK